MVKKKKIKPNNDLVGLNKSITEIKEILEKVSPDLAQKLRVAEHEATRAKTELAFLKEKLTSFLTPDQLDAAKTCDCKPEIYAIEFFELWKQNVWQNLGTIGLKPLSELRGL